MNAIFAKHPDYPEGVELQITEQKPCETGTQVTLRMFGIFNTHVEALVYTSKLLKEGRNIFFGGNNSAENMEGWEEGDDNIPVEHLVAPHQ